MNNNVPSTPTGDSLSGYTPAKKTKQVQILDAIKAGGQRGVTNLDLNRIQFRYGASIHRLRKDGYDIETIRDSAAIYRFVLKGQARLSF